MRRYVLTRSAYGPAWSDEANARRLTITRGVTVASMRAQADRDWTWIVALNRDDPLRNQRRAVFESAGVPVEFVYLDSEATDRDRAAYEAYSADWASVIGPRTEAVAMTRLDDDDALAPWAMGRIGEESAKAKRRSALILPRGIRVWSGHLTIVRHSSNAMQTLVTMPGDVLHVYGYGHRDVRDVASVHNIDNRFGWVWSRHEDTISGWHTAEAPIHERIREMFPIDWSVLDGPARPRTGPAGRYFR